MPSIPTPAALTNTRPLSSPTSMTRRRARARNAGTSRSLRGYPRLRARSLPVPIGYSASAVVVPTSPFAISFAVPSPPAAMTVGYPSSAASAASRAASAGAGVTSTSIRMPASRNTRASSAASFRPLPWPASGFRIAIAFAAPLRLTPGS